MDELEQLRAEPEPATPRRHNATCPRCYGPAYVGLGLPRCEREGGCLADREPHTVAWPASMEVGKREADILEVPEGNGPDDDGERGWWVHEIDADAVYATRGLAIAAWREAVLDRAKREAGR